MRNPELPRIHLQTADINNLSSTRNGRRFESVEKMEALKESAEQRIDDLLKALSESLGKVLTLADLPDEFGDVGERIKNCFQSVMSCNSESEMFSVLGRFVEATNALEKTLKKVQ